jgi:hypothetical protein
MRGSNFTPKEYSDPMRVQRHTKPVPDSFASDILKLRRVRILSGNGSFSDMPPTETS